MSLSPRNKQLKDAATRIHLSARKGGTILNAVTLPAAPTVRNANTAWHVWANCINIDSPSIPIIAEREPFYFEFSWKRLSVNSTVLPVFVSTAANSATQITIRKTSSTQLQLYVLGRLITVAYDSSLTNVHKISIQRFADSSIVVMYDNTNLIPNYGSTQPLLYTAAPYTSEYMQVVSCVLKTDTRTIINYPSVYEKAGLLWNANVDTRSLGLQRHFSNIKGGIVLPTVDVRGEAVSKTVVLAGKLPLFTTASALWGQRYVENGSMFGLTWRRQGASLQVVTAVIAGRSVTLNITVPIPVEADGVSAPLKIGLSILPTGLGTTVALIIAVNGAIVRTMNMAGAVTFPVSTTPTTTAAPFGDRFSFFQDTSSTLTAYAKWVFLEGILLDRATSEQELVALTK